MRNTSGRVRYAEPAGLPAVTCHGEVSDAEEGAVDSSEGLLFGTVRVR